MKNIYLAIMGLFLSASMLQGQNDYMYIMKDGVAISKQSVKSSDVDSIIYHEPAHTLTTTAVSSISSTTAICGGNINYYTGAIIASCGVCWSTSPSPVASIGNGMINRAGGIEVNGVFTSTITGLTLGTTYFVRAYAVNNSGVVTYGNEISFKTHLSIGDLYLGGKIAYLDDSGIHGFVCQLTDQQYATWSNGSLITISGAHNVNLETTGVYGILKSGGRMNTDAIITAQGVGNYAASICAALTTGNAALGDWYLPSIGELNQMYVNKVILGITTSSLWSSSEEDINRARYFLFDRQVSGTKSSSLPKVRAIRAF